MSRESKRSPDLRYLAALEKVAEAARLVLNPSLAGSVSSDHESCTAAACSTAMLRDALAALDSEQ